MSKVIGVMKCKDSSVPDFMVMTVHLVDDNEGYVGIKDDGEEYHVYCQYLDFKPVSKWKYLKGSEKDFEGAPEWATLLTFTGGNSFFAESHSIGAKVYGIAQKDEFTIGDDGVDEKSIEIIAHRQLISDDEQDLNECIGAPEVSAKVGELHIDGKVHTTQLGGGDIPALIAERGNRYGKFKDGAEIMRDLKHVMHEVDGWNELSPSQKEALDMIQHKIGRILNGDPNYDDNWKDIAGYAKLIADELNGEVK